MSQGNSGAPDAGAAHIPRGLTYREAVALDRFLLGEDREFKVRRAMGAAVIPFLSAVFDPYRKKSDHLDWGLRARAAWVLGEIGDASAVPALIHALKDENPDVRVKSAHALGNIAEKGGDCSAAVPALIDVLKARPGETREWAAWALVEIGSPAVPALIDALNHKYLGVQEAVAKALVEIGSPAVPALIDALTLSESDVQEAVAGVLREIGDASAVPALVDALKDENLAVRVKAAVALGNIAKKGGDCSAAVPALIDALKDGNEIVRMDAADALGRIGDASAVPALIETLKEKVMNVRWTTAGALGEMGASAVSALADALKDEVADVRQRAARALVKIGSPAVPALADALKDEVADVRRTAARALGEIGGKSDIDLRAVERALGGYVDLVKKKGDAVEIKKAKGEARGYYLQISKAARKRAAEKHSLAGDGVILEGTFKAPADGKKGMYRQARAAV